MAVPNTYDYETDQKRIQKEHERLKMEMESMQNAWPSAGINTAGTQGLQNAMSQRQLGATSNDSQHIFNEKVRRMAEAYELTEHPSAVIRAVHPHHGAGWYYQVRVFANPGHMEGEKVSNKWFTYSNLADVHPPGLQPLLMGLTEHYSAAVRAFTQGGPIPTTDSYKPDGCEPSSGFVSSTNGDYYATLVVNGPQWAPVLMAKQENA